MKMSKIFKQHKGVAHGGGWQGGEMTQTMYAHVNKLIIIIIIIIIKEQHDLEWRVGGQ
jgi:hypothetical protein